MTQRSHRRRSARKRNYRFEQLECRNLLAADVAAIAEADLDAIELAPASQIQPIMIQSATLRINGELRTVAADFETVDLQPGDVVEVVGVGYDVHSSVGQQGGVLALEGYLNKLGADDLPSTQDWSDGRFSARQDNPPLAVGVQAHAGLTGSWRMEVGWNRLSLSLVHYTADGAVVADRHFVKLQVGQPEFVVDPQVADTLLAQHAQLGEQLSIRGAWSNLGQGRYHNYSEVDVYHVSNLDQPEWVGVLAGSAGPGESVAGEYYNPNPQDAFAEFWTPAASGEYLLKFYADPEDLWHEPDETNNVLEVKLTVLPANAAPQAEHDMVKVQHNASVDLNVVANDSDPDGDVLTLSSFTQPAHGAVTWNADGTLRYTPAAGFVGIDDFSYTVSDGAAASQASVTIEVQPQLTDPADPVADGGKIKVKSPKLRVGQWSKLDIRVKLRDQDGSEEHEVLLRGLPSYVRLSAGQRRGDDWVLTLDDLDGLKMTVDSDESLVKKQQTVRATAVLVSTESATGDTLTQETKLRLKVRTS